MKSARARGIIYLHCNLLGVVKTTGARAVERRIITFFKEQIKTLPKNDCTAGYLSGELMAWGLCKVISKDTEMELESLLCKEWGIVFSNELQD